MMDVRLPQRDRPIYVDLDGTVIRSDLLWESLFMLARQAPSALARVPAWAMRGRARLKSEIAGRIAFDPSLLPYREDVIAELAREQANGRRIVLATDANEKLARAVAEHVGVFDAVMASDAEVDLRAERKLERILAENDAEGFDYLGNSPEDLRLLDRPATAPDASSNPGQRSAAACPAPESDLRTRVRSCFKAMRPHQWTKNLLVFVPLALEHDYLNPSMMLVATATFLAFSFAASAVYIVNDLLDLAADRQHRTKRRRPFASGMVPIPVGLALAAGLLAASSAIALFMDWRVQLVLVGYLVLTTLYSFALKRMLMIDVLALASLYSLRIIAGGVATGVELSFWLMAFSIFFFLSLALVKRFTELLDFGVEAERSITGRGYTSVDIETIGQAGMASGFASVLVLALYIDSPEVQEMNAIPWMLWPLCPLVLYIIVRIWVLARRNQMHEDPVVFILRDWRSQIMIAAGAVMFVTAAYV